MVVMEEEASEDMMKFGGITGSDAGMQDLSVSALKSAAGRIPWLVGLLIGVVNGILISIIAAFWHDSLILGFVIGLSLWVTMFFATLAGTIIPLIMSKINIDPAVASGPFITTLNDLVGLTIYFTVATWFMKYLV